MGQLKKSSSDEELMDLLGTTERNESLGASTQELEEGKSSGGDTMALGATIAAGQNPEELNKLGCSHFEHFQSSGRLEDLQKAVERLSQAVVSTLDGDPDMPSRLSDLAVAYTRHFECLGDSDDLENAIKYSSRAVALTSEGHPNMPSYLTNLVAPLRQRFLHLGKLDDLERSIEYSSRAVELTSEGHPVMPLLLGNLGMVYRNRFQRMGELDDLEKSIEYNSRAVELMPEGHQVMPLRLGNLGMVYRDRFERLGELDDLEKAIEYSSRAVELTSEGDPDMPLRLGNLGIAYGDRFERMDELDDLEKSIEYSSRAAKLTMEGHLDIAIHLGNLGTAYRNLYKRTGELGDLEKSVEYSSRAVTLTSEGHPDMPLRLGNLGLIYKDRFEHLGELHDLEESIDYNCRALTLTTDGHPHLSIRHFDCAHSFLSLYEHSGALAHLNKSLESFRIACQIVTGAPRDKFHCALHWASLAYRRHYLNPLEACQTTIDLLPQYIWLGATTKQRYQDLTIAKDLAVNASFTAMGCWNFSLALEWLEQARCVVWNQFLALRSPVDELCLSHPALASQLQIIANQLHISSFEGQRLRAAVSDSGNPGEAGRQRRRLAMDYQSLLAEIRQLVGFEDFLQPIKTSKLLCAARNGPVVVVVCHAYQCNALIIMTNHDEIKYLPLANFTEQKARQAHSDLVRSLQKKRLRQRGVRVLHQQKFEDSMGQVLESLWRDIVQPVLDCLGYMSSTPQEPLPHITWCPTGPLSFLPLHAAGDYTQPQPRTFDYVISSYTPTLSALLSSTPSSLNRDCRVLAIGQAATPGRKPLPGTVKELAHIGTHMHNKVDYSQLIGTQATTAAVLDAMEQHDWVHLACHAHQNVRDPTKSGFYLHDGTLDLSAINQRSFRNKGLAFLSACQTATGDEELPDEAIHLASGMLMAGYSSVIATMWSVVDEDAPLVADKVYARLMEEGKVGNGEAGRALHDAVAELRKKIGEVEFGRWVPYIHIGS